MIKFAVYTSFFNSVKYIDRLYENIMSINYKNFTWFVTDDYSTDDTKKKLLKKIRNNNKVVYVEQNHKMEMYWTPNKFIPPEYDYVLLVDSDDLVDSNILSVYNNLINKHENVSIITCDFIKKHESDNSLHSYSYILNQERLYDKLSYYHPEIDYLNNLSYYCFGHGRCFKNIKNFEFKVNSFNDITEDSYRMLYMNGYGNWLHVPRVLYHWTMRDSSVSSINNKNHNLTYNVNFDIGLEKSKNSSYESVYCYNSIYKELNSLMFSGINIKQKNISIISNHLDVLQKQRIKEVYLDKNIKFNEYTGCELYVIVLNHFYDIDALSDVLKNLKSKNKNIEINAYHLNDSIYLDINKIHSDVRVTHEKYDKVFCSEFGGLNFFFYMRHLNYKITYAN